jgi:hypothetical protein
MTNIVYLAHGNSRIYFQARFSILTLLHLLEKDNADCRIVVYTDSPSFFDRYNVSIRELSQETIRQWKGEYDFVHRVKIKMLDDCLNLGGHLFYLDTDTYFKTHPGELFSSLSKDTSIMFRNEGVISGQNHHLFHRFLRKHSTSLHIPVVDSISMWNSGVIGLHSHNLGLVRRVLQLNDDIYPSFSAHTVEQFSFSYVLQDETTIKDAESFITHYVGPTRPQVEERIIPLIEDHRYAADFRLLCKVAYQLDPAAGLSPPRKTFRGRLLDFARRQNKSLKKRMNKLGWKLRRPD